MDEYRMTRRVLMVDESGGLVRGRPSLGWQQRDDCGGCATIRER